MTTEKTGVRYYPIAAGPNSMQSMSPLQKGQKPIFQGRITPENPSHLRKKLGSSLGSSIREEDYFGFRSK